MSQDRRAKLLLQKAQIEARLREMAARETAQERRNETRRKIIAGALALEHAELDEEFRQTLFRLINRFTKREQDRALFGLDSIESVQQEPANDSVQTADAGQEAIG